MKVNGLSKPFGINQSQDFEFGEGVFYKHVYKTDVTPYQVQTDANGRKTRKWFWTYDL